MPERWIAEAEQLTPSGAPGTMSGVGPARAICHVTVSRPGSFDAMHRVLTDKQGEPHLLYDWATDRLGQYFPLDRSARALKRGARDVSCNKVGTVCIQIEFCSLPDGFTSYWTPGPNFRALMRAVRSWGVEPRWVARAGTTIADNVRQTWETYLSTGGWWGHCHVPENDHWDPGPIDQAAFLAAAEGDNMPTPAEIATAVWSAPMDGETMGNRLYFAHRRAQAAVDELAKVRAELAVLAAKVDALTASPVSGTVTVTGGTLTVGT